MRALEFITDHVIYNLAYTYKFQLKTTIFITTRRSITAGLYISNQTQVFFDYVFIFLPQRHQIGLLKENVGGYI